MTPLFRKLNLGAHRTVHVLDAPASFEPELAALEGVAVERSVEGPVVFALAFVTTLAGVERATALFAAAALGDALIWMAYPKATSRRLRCEFHRDNGFAALGAAGYEPVRIVAIDDDWSALRFRHVAFVGAMTRSPGRAISAAGRRKAGGGA